MALWLTKPYIASSGSVCLSGLQSQCCRVRVLSESPAGMDLLLNLCLLQSPLPKEVLSVGSPSLRLLALCCLSCGLWTWLFVLSKPERGVFYSWCVCTAKEDRSYIPLSVTKALTSCPIILTVLFVQWVLFGRSALTGKGLYVRVWIPADRSSWEPLMVCCPMNRLQMMRSSYFPEFVDVEFPVLTHQQFRRVDEFSILCLKFKSNRWSETIPSLLPFMLPKPFFFHVFDFVWDVSRISAFCFWAGWLLRVSHSVVSASSLPRFTWLGLSLGSAQSSYLYVSVEMS